MMTHKRCAAGGGLLIRASSGYQCESATGVAQSKTLSRPSNGPMEKASRFPKWDGTCALRNVVQDAGARVGQLRSGGLGGKSGGFRFKSRRKYRVIPLNPA
jgi:hypothetical protein